ncbi:unnamed protein product, partial [Chrysoparadoxa australica]
LSISSSVANPSGGERDTEMEKVAERQPCILSSAATGAWRWDEIENQVLRHVDVLLPSAQAATLAAAAEADQVAKSVILSSLAQSPSSTISPPTINSAVGIPSHAAPQASTPAVSFSGVTSSSHSAAAATAHDMPVPPLPRPVVAPHTHTTQKVPSIRPIPAPMAGGMELDVLGEDMRALQRRMAVLEEKLQGQE